MPKPVLPRLDPSRIDRDVMTAIHRLADYGEHLEGTLATLRQQVADLPPPLTTDQVTAAMLPLLRTPTAAIGIGSVATTPLPATALPLDSGVTAPPAGWVSPPVPTDPRRRIKAGFCNATDSTGHPIFTAGYCGQSAPRRAEWLANRVAAGDTHFVMSVVFSYAVGGLPSFDLSGAPATFRGFVNEVIAAGLIPIIFLSTGDPGSFEAAVGHLDGSGNLTPDGYWTTFIPGLTSVPDLTDSCLWVPGWELVIGGWNSLQFSVGIQRMGTLLSPDPLMYAHLSAERGSFASNPVEPNDPWQGGESLCWKNAGGELLTGLLYQAPTGVKLFGPGYAWFDRWYEIMVRAGQGGVGWRQIDVCWFEAGAFDYIRGFHTAAEVTAVRVYAMALGPVGYGNG